MFFKFYTKEKLKNIVNQKMQEENKTAKLNDYVISKELGSGLNSKVKLGVDTKTGMKLAIKIMKGGQRAESNTKAMKNEHEVLLKLSHPNIIKLVE